METTDAVTALAALAQDSRLEIFRLLVRTGPEGMAAGQVAERLGLAPNTLTFHFDRLRIAGLVSVRRDGRSMIYARALRDDERAAVLPDRELLPGRGRNLRARGVVQNQGSRQ